MLLEIKFPGLASAYPFLFLGYDRQDLFVAQYLAKRVRDLLFGISLPLRGLPPLAGKGLRNRRFLNLQPGQSSGLRSDCPFEVIGPSLGYPCLPSPREGW